MRRFGIIGYPLGHSFSQRYFTEKFQAEGLGDHVYDKYPLASIEEFPALVATTPDLVGLNVTIPYKQAVIPCLDDLDPQARAIGAVNCIRVSREGGKVFLKGYNTDMPGFETSLGEMLGGRRPEALVLGTGGASKAVTCALGRLGIRHRLVSRSGDGTNTLSYGELTPELIAATPLIVNATPLGTFPDVETLPDIPYEALGREHFLHDLVYNPAETAFMHQGRRRGATVKNGYAMLIGQAQAAWEVWGN
jgi:shikimate dehydrogenase